MRAFARQPRAAAKSRNIATHSWKASFTGLFARPTGEPVKLGDLAFGRDRAEQPVPDDQHAAVVAVEELGIAGMVSAVMVRRVEYPFERPQARYPLAVQEELVIEVDREQRGDEARIEADDDQRQIGEPAERQNIGPAQPQRCEKGQLLGAVVDGMARPEPADLMAEAVEPVIGELDREEPDKPAMPLVHGEAVRRDGPDRAIDAADDQRARRPGDQIAGDDAERGQRRAAVIAARGPQPPDELAQDRKRRDRKNQRPVLPDVHDGRPQFSF